MIKRRLCALVMALALLLSHTSVWAVGQSGGNDGTAEASETGGTDGNGGTSDADGTDGTGGNDAVNGNSGTGGASETSGADGTGEASETSGVCGEDVTWFLDSGGVLTLDGSGETYAYNQADGYAPWYGLRDRIRSVRMAGEITALNGVLFNGCENLTDIALCASLEQLVIGDRYDRWPDSILSVSTPSDSVNYESHDGVLYARSASGREYDAGAEAGKFTLLFYPPARGDPVCVMRDGTEAAADGAFSRCANLERLVLNDGLTRIPRLYHCTALREIVIPASAVTLPPSAFEGCSALTEVRLPSGVREIPSFAFYGCSALETLDIPSTVTTVNTSAFWLCDALNPITLPASVQTVRGTALPGGATADLSRYKDWYFQGDVPDFQNWTGGVMASFDGSGMVPVGDRIYYRAGAAGWAAYIREFQYQNGADTRRTIFAEYGDQPVRRGKVWMDGDGSVLDSVTWMEGERVPGDTARIPTKAPSDGFTYTFDHWDEGTASGDTTIYYPVFSSEQTDPHYGMLRVIYRASVGGERQEAYCDSGAEITLEENPFEAPEGKVFRAWAILGTEYQPGDQYVVTEDVFVTAQWEDDPNPPAPDPAPGTDPTSTPGTDPTSTPGTDPASAPSPGSSGASDPAPNPGGSTTPQGCYVATAVYGSYDCPEVWTLRRFRDNVLAKTWYGRLFIRCYYAVSPTAVGLFGGADWFQAFFRRRLDRLTDRLRREGFSSAPYEDLPW